MMKARKSPKCERRFPSTCAKNIWKLSYLTQITSCPRLPPGYTSPPAPASPLPAHTHIHTLTHSCPKTAIMVVWFQISVFLLPCLRLFALNRDLENFFFFLKANPFFCYFFNCESTIPTGFWCKGASLQSSTWASRQLPSWNLGKNKWHLPYFLPGLWLP